jgi:tryptophan-rich sensory protein
LTALARLLPHYQEHPSTVWLLILLMLANAGANIPQFRLRRLDIAFFYLFPYWVLLAAFVWRICSFDPVSTGLFTIYATYQLYAAAWAWTLWRLNQAPGPA